MQVQPLDQEDPLEEEMATYSSILPGESMDREAWWATVHRVTKSWTRLKQLNTNVCTRGWLTFVEKEGNFLYPSRFFC